MIRWSLRIPERTKAELLQRAGANDQSIGEYLDAHCFPQAVQQTVASTSQYTKPKAAPTTVGCDKGAHQWKKYTGSGGLTMRKCERCDTPPELAR